MVGVRVCVLLLYSQLSSCMIQVCTSIGKFFRSIGHDNVNVSLNLKKEKQQRKKRVSERPLGHLYHMMLSLKKVYLCFFHINVGQIETECIFENTKQHNPFVSVNISSFSLHQWWGV